jgi:rhamnulokinase
MTAKQQYLAVDLGAESGRVISGEFDGSKVTLNELHRFSNGPVKLAGTLRWDVLGLWSEIQTGLAKAAADSVGESVVSVGVDTWGVDYVLLSKTDELLGQPYHYRDSRTDGLLAATTSRVSRSEIFAATGLQFMEINTLYQLLAMQQTDANLLAEADRFLMIADFFHWCLSGSRVVEFTNATTTQCFDPVGGQWSHDLLRKLALPSHIFPDVVPPGTQLGSLRGEVAELTGLKRVQVVAPATHDTGSAVAAVPTELTGTARWAYISSGTWSLIGVEVPDAALSERALEFNVTNEGGIDGTYRLLKNVMGLWLVQQCRRSFERRGTSPSYAEMVQAAEAAPPFRSLVDPDDASFLKPDDMPSAMQQWCRQTDQHAPETIGELVRCALESLALKYRLVLQQIEELTGTAVEVIHIVGGGSQNELLNQFTANACGCPVVAGPIEATALGNVLVQARAAGEIGTLAEIRGVVRNSSRLQHYEPQHGQAWQAAVEKLQQLRIAAPGN